MGVEQVTDLDIDAIEERANAATPGPWETAYDTGESIHAEPTLYAPGNVEIAATFRADDDRFIAHAREDVPALIAEVRRLRFERDAFADAALVTPAELVVAQEWEEELQHRNATLTAENERLRAQLDLTLKGMTGWVATEEVMRGEDQ